MKKYTTIQTERRWKYAGTVIALILIMSLPAAILGGAAGVLALGAISQGWLVLYGTVVLMAATWAFGEETLTAVRRARGKETAADKKKETVVKETDDDEDEDSEQNAGGFDWNK